MAIDASLSYGGGGVVVSDRSFWVHAGFSRRTRMPVKTLFDCSSLADPDCRWIIFRRRSLWSLANRRRRSCAMAGNALRVNCRRGFCSTNAFLCRCAMRCRGMKLAPHATDGLGWHYRRFALMHEQAGFEVFVVANKNLCYQQNLSMCRIAILELWTNHRPTLEEHFPEIQAAVERIQDRRIHGSRSAQKDLSDVQALLP